MDRLSREEQNHINFAGYIPPPGLSSADGHSVRPSLPEEDIIFSAACVIFSIIGALLIIFLALMFVPQTI